MDGYRKELKYIVDDATLMDVRNRISGLMRRDSHQQGECYRIRSVYFDSPSYECFRENMAGVSSREKYRIRTYECSDNVISAEIKIRHRDTISKISTRISKELFDAILSDRSHKALDMLARCVSGQTESSLSDKDKRVLEKYYSQLSSYAYRPVCIVDYERNAYVYDIGNVRITFDRNITASTDYRRFFDKDLTGMTALPDGQHILEIKYDEFLPREILSVLGGMSLTRSSSSKYAQCAQRILSA